MVQSIDRAVSLLRLLMPGERGRELGVLELSRASGLPLGTVHRLLESMARHGLVARDSVTRKYRLGWTLVELGLSVLEGTELRTAAYPIMVSLARTTQETIYLAVRDEAQGILIEKVDSPLHLRIMEPLGLRSPLYVGASRKVILAYLPEHDRRDILAEFVPPVDPDKRGASTREILERQLADIRAQGYAVSYGETTPGTAAVAVPLRDYRGRITASLSAAGPASRFTDETVPRILATLQEGAAEIETRIGACTLKPKG